MINKKVMSAVATAMMLTMAVPSAFAATGGDTSSSSTRIVIDAKSASDAYLKQNAAHYHLQADLKDLQYVTTIHTDAADFVRYQQTVNGVELYSKQLTVTLDKSGQAVLVTSDYVPNLQVETVSNKISENAAEAKAIDHLKAQGNWAPNSRKLVYFAKDGKAVPAYRVLVHSTAPYGEFETFVHAGTGDVLQSRDLLEKATGTGKVFNPNPVRTQGSATGLTDNRNADSTALTNQLQTVTLQGLDGSGYLVGSYASIKSKAKTYSSTLTYNYTRSSNSFEDVMAYYHIDTLQRYIQSLGFTNVNNRAILVNVDASTQDNSWYSPSTKDLTFGTGGVDDAEDASIIAHEYGHSIQDNQVPNFGATEEGGAMGEGFGDFMGATYEDFLAPSSFFKGCLGEWDATSYSTTNPPCLRRLDNNKVYPTDMVNEVHDDGEIWSQGEYDMANAFGRDVATKIILQSHFSLTPNAGFNDGARAIKAADQTLYGGAHASQIDAIWAARGISTK